MSEKPTIDVMPRNLVSLPAPPRVFTVPTPPQVVPPSFPTPQTSWGANRLARYYDALTAVTKAQTGYHKTRTIHLIDPNCADYTTGFNPLARAQINQAC
jgi:hypothetical protein